MLVRLHVDWLSIQMGFDITVLPLPFSLQSSWILQWLVSATEWQLKRMSFICIDVKWALHLGHELMAQCLYSIPAFSCLSV